eukprot:gene12293-2242_t
MSAEDSEETNWHGILRGREICKSSMQRPAVAAACEDLARPGGLPPCPRDREKYLNKHQYMGKHTGYTGGNATEYLDSPEVLEKKCCILADMLRASLHTLLYTGAGISTASGIRDYATKAKGSVAAPTKKVSSLSAKPTLTHKVLTELHRAGLAHSWVQQNHDGLPQKAGFPQSCLNEVHGAWFDPTNPVVKMNGCLRGDLIDWLYSLAENADLTIALGTSMSGMNADR